MMDSESKVEVIEKVEKNLENLQNLIKERREKSLEWYKNLSDEDRFSAVQAVIEIACEAEKSGCSHRQLQKELGIYPQGFWIMDLSNLHNALWEFYQNQEIINFE